MKPFALLAFAALVPVAAQAKPTKPSSRGVVWRTDYDVALKEARRAHKPVFVDFYTDWCGWCKVLDAKTYTDPKFIRASRNWVMVKLNAEKGDRNVALTRQFGVNGFPTLLMLSARGKELNRIPGYMPTPGLMEEMRKALAADGALSAQNPAPRTLG